ncbi:hypothetical protein [Actinophytocola algeriensis]|uniref:DUF4367 domain-containing protein n=1 Tax=Actinophytocola algeriensis TaxID=1768010 RepID=A0A7W7VI63_9PSEU|nr:hypothetical protein [Actinophytocola algeriensis]MBB4910755.1 hypothetical protein [Actinophytocola algeriensis]MBE1473748.1 hypothetical protein [Actinophytocola algeriensis]
MADHSDVDDVDDLDLESALRSLGARLDVPDAPHLTSAVLARLDEPAPPVWPRRVLTAAVAAVVALATAMVVSPAVRAAVVEFLRIGAVEIHQNQPAPVTPSLDPPLPGERDVTLAEAAEAADFPLRLPTTLGPPGAVRLIDDGRVVTMAFGAVRVDQFDGGLAPMFTKFTHAADIHHVTVDSSPAIWVDRPHPVLYTDRDGTLRDESARLAASTLIWEKDGVTYRVEGDLRQRQAIEIAESMF